MNVLIVEDSLIQAEGLKELIKEECPDFDVRTAGDFDSAAGAVQEGDFDAFFLDIMLGGDKTGLDVCDYLRSMDRYADTPVVFISDITSPTLDVINRYHCSYYFSKPYEKADVVAALHSITAADSQAVRAGVRLKDIQGVYFSLTYDELVCVRIEGHHKHIYTTAGDFIVTNPVFDTLLGGAGGTLVRCHRSCFFNPGYTVSYDRLNSCIQLSGLPDTIPVGRKYKSDIDRALLGQTQSQE